MRVVNNIFDKSFGNIPVGESNFEIKVIPARATLRYLSSEKLQKSLFSKKDETRILPKAEFDKLSDDEKKKHLSEVEKQQKEKDNEFLNVINDNYDEILEVILPVVKKNIKPDITSDWIDENIKITEIMQLFTMVFQNIGFSNENPDVKKN